MALTDLRFADPQHDAEWAHAVVPAGSAPVSTSVAGAAATTGLDDLQVAGAGRVHDLAEWMAATSTTSLLVLDAAGETLHESYADGVGPRTAFLGASMTKSVLAHLVGRAAGAGELALTDAVVDHVPELAGSGYAATTVHDVLTMTTGVAWAEDYRDPDSLATRLLEAFAGADDSRALLREIGPADPPGTRFAYCTADSQVLDWVRERATGRSYADDAARLWSDLACTADAYVACDGKGVAMAGGGLAATTRDWARVARLAVDGCAEPGREDLRLLDPGWVEAAARPAYDFTGVGRLPSTITTHAGFGRHWWPLDGAGRRVTADGSRGQFACVDRRSAVTVVKTSLWPYADPMVDRQARDLSYLGLHAILDHVGALAG